MRRERRGRKNRLSYLHHVGGLLPSSLRREGVFPPTRAHTQLGGVSSPNRGALLTPPPLWGGKHPRVGVVPNPRRKFFEKTPVRVSLPPRSPPPAWVNFVPRPRNNIRGLETPPVYLEAPVPFEKKFLIPPVLNPKMSWKKSRQFKIGWPYQNPQF